jgi:hypothetical protein
MTAKEDWRIKTISLTEKPVGEPSQEIPMKSDWYPTAIAVDSAVALLILFIFGLTLEFIARWRDERDQKSIRSTRANRHIRSRSVNLRREPGGFKEGSRWLSPCEQREQRRHHRTELQQLRAKLSAHL